MPDVASFPQELVRGFDLGAVLALKPHPLLGYLLLFVGLALCLTGYFLYRLMVALASAVAGGAIAYLVMPGFGIDGIALWAGVLGSMMVLFVVGWFLYEVAIFLVGSFAGLVLGLVLWLLTSEQFTSLGDLRDLTIGGGDLPKMAIAAFLPAIVFGLLAVRWEKGAITLIAVILGAFVFALGLRYAHLQGPMGSWGPPLVGALLALGLFVNFRPKPRPQAAAALRRRASASE